MFNRRQHRLRCEPALIQGIARRLSALLPADGKETLPINSRKFNSLVLAEVLLLLENATCRRDI
ncbi:MAG: hypothetical protein P8N76_24030 [Pirellulaceae bacterium]|nr:hypothetical protein [Pirellulaceae bacterium]